jgi:DNA-binding CsgD family transcriptional regulator
MALTIREREVLAHLTAGHDPSAISRRMGVSMHTVRGYLARLRAEYGVNSLPQVIIEALARGDAPCPCRGC